MCNDDFRVPHLTRRALGPLALGLAACGGAPRVALAASIDALGVTCIDYRLVVDGVRFFDGLKLTGDYDQLALAGASLAAVSPAFPSSNAAFWDHVDIAKSLHHIRRVIVIDHRDCGAYKVAFGKDYASEHDAETAQHKGVMQKAKATLAEKHPDLGSEFYLMALDGTAERIL